MARRMTGPQRHVAKAVAACTLGRAVDLSDGGLIAEVAILSRYPDLEDRRHIEALVDKGYAVTRPELPDGSAPTHVRLTASGWMEVLCA